MPKLYNDLLITLKQFQEENYPDHPTLLETFYTPSFIALVHKENDENNKSIKIDFLELMQYLVRLKEALPKDKETLWYLICRDVLFNGIQLAQDIAQSRNSWYSSSKVKYINRNEKIAALTITIQAATEVVKDPGNQTKCNTLISKASTLRREIEGPSLFRKENRFLSGFIGTVGTLIGAGLFIIGILLEPISFGGSTSALLIGATLFSVSLGMLTHALFPHTGRSDAHINENKHSHEIAGAISALAKSDLILFSRKKEDKKQIDQQFLSANIKS